MMNAPAGDEKKGGDDKEPQDNKDDTEEEEESVKLEQQVNFYTHENRWPALMIEDSRYAMVMDEPPNFNEFSHYVAILY